MAPAPGAAVSLGRWLLGGAVAAGALLVARDVLAAPVPRWARPRRATTNADKARIALARLADFIRAARIDATARLDHLAAGLTLGVRPGPAFVAEDAAALPREVDGLDVWIDGWPR